MHPQLEGWQAVNVGVSLPSIYPRCYLLSSSRGLISQYVDRRSPVWNLGHESVLGIGKPPSGRIWSHTQKGNCVRCTNAAGCESTKERVAYAVDFMYSLPRLASFFSQLTRSTLHEFLSSTLFTYIKQRVSHDPLINALNPATLVHHRPRG